MDVITYQWHFLCLWISNSSHCTPDGATAINLFDVFGQAHAVIAF